MSTVTEKATPGRPPLRSHEETIDLLVSAAVEEYRRSGYAKSAMGAIAKRAGMSLRTLYKIVTDKEALFRIAAERRIAKHILSLDVHSASLSSAPKQALMSLTRAYAHQVLNHETLLTTKLVIAESDQFPELGQAFLESTGRIAKAFDHNFSLIAANGKLDISDDQIELLRLILIGSQRSAILSPDKPYSSQEIEQLADRALNLILGE